MSVRFILLGVVCVATCGGCGGPETSSYSTPIDRLPPDWKLSDLTRAAFYNETVAQDAHVLIWAIEEDNRPLRAESCILWLKWKEEGKDCWTLAHLCRHPPIGWGLMIVFDAPQTSRWDYDHPRTNPEVYEFLKATWWKFEPDDGFQLLDAAVCTSAWKKAIGEAPTKFYDFRL
jgi:hypothetical protein